MNAPTDDVVGRLPDKPGLVNSVGVHYLEFRRTLKPRYRRLWLAMAGADGVVVLVVVLPIVVIGNVGLITGLALAVVLALVLGFSEYVLSLVSGPRLGSR